MENLTLTPVTSSLLVAVGFDPATQELVIEFPRGARYAYTNPDNPAEARTHYDKLLSPETESVGKYFLANIKNKTELKFRRLDVPEQKPQGIMDDPANVKPGKEAKASSGLKAPEPLKKLF